jgi:hypothetical protein
MNFRESARNKPLNISDIVGYDDIKEQIAEFSQYDIDVL